MGLFSGPGVTPSLKGSVTNDIELQAGQCFLMGSPGLGGAGWFATKPGKYTTFQEYDPITTTWRSIGAGPSDGLMEYNYSDGQNYRLANQTGCVVGSRVTGAGSGFTSKPTVTVSAGNAIFLPIIGGAISTTVTISNGGTNYTYPPVVLISAPPSPGVQATAYATLTNGAVTSITVIDQGAGYVTPPTISFINDPREGVNGVALGYNAAAVTTLTGAGTLTALLCIDHGSAIAPTSSLPTITISGGGGTGATAVAIMDWSITSYTLSGASGGAGYSGNVLISAYGGFTTSSAAYLNPTIEQNLVKGRNAQIVASISGSALTSSGQTVNDGGVYPGLPNWISYYNTPPTTAANLTFLMGGQTDVSIVLTV